MDYRDNGHKPEETTLIQSIPFGKDTELRVEVMTWLGPEPNRTAISARLFVPGKHTGEEGKMFPTKSGIFVRPENVPRLIHALQEAQDVIKRKLTEFTATQGGSTGSTGSTGPRTIPSPAVVAVQGILEPPDCLLAPSSRLLPGSYKRTSCRCNDTHSIEQDEMLTLLLDRLQNRPYFAP